MARVKLTEYRAKKLLIDNYTDGICIHLSSLDKDLTKLNSKQRYIVKVDQGIKKRGKRGLIRLNVVKNDAKNVIQDLARQGFERFIAEPMFPHKNSEEQYLSIERMREGFKVLYSPSGGVDIEEYKEGVQEYYSINDVPLSNVFLSDMTKVMDKEHLSFVEVNPLIIRSDRYTLLDAAVLADSAGIWQSSWNEDDIVDVVQKSEVERIITELNNGSPASFSFRTLNPDGSIWLLLSGGGASITIADETVNLGKADMIGNYGEYSGGPTREETQLYTEAVLKQMFQSRAPRKAIVIAGGVANFTDVKETFAGIIDALSIWVKELQTSKIKVYVRRGGPNEKEGLMLMNRFLKQYNIYGSVHGSDKVLTIIVGEALGYVDV